MNSTIKILAFACFFLSFSACNSSKNTASSNTENSNTENSKAEVYRLIVSFFSTASGIDQKARKGFVEWVTIKGSSVKMETVRWGREGEVDYCFSLNGMSSDEQSKFVNEAKENLSSAKNVHFYENEACKHKNNN